ncbi:hypothetical protein PAI11_32940 [Patulibacter medicamentivorans]|uniref:Uncharacterized protein n=1 Tax=Patulibacter medicamentivorans TaxID=1097667 RepID=H0E8Y0_9ACTN|nr:hypothetical protein PAI11_32940 [Patulibacter medicamentivorans]
MRRAAATLPDRRASMRTRWRTTPLAPPRRLERCAYAADREPASAACMPSPSGHGRCARGLDTACVYRDKRSTRTENHRSHIERSTSRGTPNQRRPDKQQGLGGSFPRHVEPTPPRHPWSREDRAQP